MANLLFHLRASPSIANEGDLAADNFTSEAIARAGYKACGPRIIRFDILNRLAAVIRQAQRESGTRRFRIMQEMLALLGCTYEEMRGVLQSLGYKFEVVEDDKAEGLRPELAAAVPNRFVEDNPVAKPKEAAETKAEADTPAEEAADPKTPDRDCR